LAVSGKTKIAGIIGDPVSHSLSPFMHNAAYQAMGLDIIYIPMLVKGDSLLHAISGIRALGFLGINVTIPHKVAVASLVDRLDDTARITGAVNTIVNEGDLLAGYNTDGIGFIRSLEEEVDMDYLSTSVLLLGAGGAARSVGVSLAQKGVKRIQIANRNRDRADELMALLESNFDSMAIHSLTLEEVNDTIMDESMLIINATSLGMKNNLKPLHMVVDRLSNDHIVYDLVYSESGLTPLQVEAEDKGATTLGGQGMLLQQGAEAILLWTGNEPPMDIMREAIEPK